MHSLYSVTTTPTPSRKTWRRQAKATPLHALSRSPRWTTKRAILSHLCLSTSPNITTTATTKMTAGGTTAVTTQERRGAAALLSRRRLRATLPTWKCLNLGQMCPSAPITATTRTPAGGTTAGTHWTQKQTTGKNRRPRLTTTTFMHTTKGGRLISRTMRTMSEAITPGNTRSQTKKATRIIAGPRGSAVRTTSEATTSGNARSQTKIVIGIRVGPRGLNRGPDGLVAQGGWAKGYLARESDKKLCKAVSGEGLSFSGGLDFKPKLPYVLEIGHSGEPVALSGTVLRVGRNSHTFIELGGALGRSILPIGCFLSH